MKIKVGGLYRTRDWMKVFISYEDENVFVGVVQEDSEMSEWDVDGRFVSPREKHPYDIVSEWSPPRKQKAKKKAK